MANIIQFFFLILTSKIVIVDSAHCIHDEIVGKVHTHKVVPQTVYSKEEKRQGNIWGSIRIDFNTDNLQDGADQYACYAGTKSVLLTNGTTVPCTSDQVLTPDKKTFILDNMIAPLKNLFEATFNVRNIQVIIV